jgi:hypothetical protein
MNSNSNWVNMTTNLRCTFSWAILGTLLFTITACGTKFDIPSTYIPNHPTSLPASQDHAMDNTLPSDTPNPIDSVRDQLAQQLLGIEGINGIGTSECSDDGRACLIVYLENDSPELKAKVPAEFQGFTVIIAVTGSIEIQGNQESKVGVELDIFSGRPNPTWTLEPALASDLMSRIARLNSTSQAVECSQNLGYRGFIVQFLDAESNAIQTVHACGGIVEVKNSTGSMYYVDPQKQVELWLLAASAQPPLSEDLVTQIIKEINAP